MLQDEINLIFEKYKNVTVPQEAGKYFKRRVEDVQKEPKLTSAQDEKILAQSAIERQKENKNEEEELTIKKPVKRLGSFEKYKLSQAKRFLKNNDKIRKMLSHMGGMTEKEARKIVKKYG